MTNSRRFFAIAALVMLAGVPLLLAPAGAQQLQENTPKVTLKR